MRTLLVTAVILLPIGVSVEADDAQPKAATFSVYPIATELQRFRLARSGKEAPRLRAYVEIDGNGVVNKDGVVELQALPVEKIRQALVPYSDRNEGIVIMNLHFGNDNDGTLRKVSDSTRKRLDGALEGIGRRAGFSVTQVSNSFGGPALEKKFGATTEKVAGRADEDEAPIGDELVTVYPVRTILSLSLTDNTDCVVDVRAPLEKQGETLLNPEVREAIVKQVAAVKLRDKVKVQFCIKGLTEGVDRNRIDQFIRTESVELARLLGFKDRSVQSR